MGSEVPALQGVRIACLATGEGHSLCVTCEGAVLSWGVGSSGQLGLGPSPRRRTRRASPTAGGGQEEEEEAANSTCRPTAVCWDVSSQPAKAVSVGKSHSLVLTRSGRVLSFGSSLYQQLGHGGNTTAVWTPRVVRRAARQR